MVTLGEEVAEAEEQDDGELLGEAGPLGVANWLAELDTVGVTVGDTGGDGVLGTVRLEEGEATGVKEEEAVLILVGERERLTL